MRKRNLSDLRMPLRLRRPALALAVCAALGTSSAGAQTSNSCVGAALPAIGAAASAADSVALAQGYLADPPGGQTACGELLAGFLLGMNSSPADTAWQARQRATELIERALRTYGDEPRLYLALAVLLHHRQSRTDALRALDRAAERAQRGEAPLSAREVAILHYTRGAIQQDFWRDWRSFGQLDAVSVGQWRCSRDEAPGLDNVSGAGSDMSWLVPVNQLCPELFAENMARYFHPRSDMNRDAQLDMEREFATAWETDTTYWAPAAALLGEYVYAADWERAEALVRRIRSRFPDDYRARLYEGLVLHETGRDSLAALAFAAVRDGVPPELGTALDDIDLLLRPEQQQALQQLDSSRQFAVRMAFWTSTDPLYLTTWNERRIEHWSRVVAAGLMFTSGTLGEIGWASFAGRAWIRYGRPRHLWELPMPAGRVVFWDYGNGPDVSFTRGFGYRSYRPTDQATQYLNALGRSSPHAYTPASIVDSVQPLDAQVVRVLGADRRPQLLVYAAWPETAGPDALAGLTLLDLLYQPVAQWRGRKPERPGIGVELKGMAPGSYALTVEVWDPANRGLHRLQDTVSTMTPRDSGLAVSDVLFVTAVSSPVGDSAASRSQLTVTPMYGTTLAKGDPLGLVWETYASTGPAEGRQRYRVSVEVQNLERRPVLTKLLRRLGGDQGRGAASRIEYESTRPVVGGQTVEWLELTSDLGIGEYRVVLTITDLTGKAVTRERMLSVR
jgi:GWxTD domain-containing protein